MLRKIREILKRVKRVYRENLEEIFEQGDGTVIPQNYQKGGKNEKNDEVRKSRQNKRKTH